jgi:hypothetical protein
MEAAKLINTTAIFFIVCGMLVIALLAVLGFVAPPLTFRSAALLQRNSRTRERLLPSFGHETGLHNWVQLDGARVRNAKTNAKPCPTCH